MQEQLTKLDGKLSHFCSQDYLLRAVTSKTVAASLCHVNKPAKCHWNQLHRRISIQMRKISFSHSFMFIFLLWIHTQVKPHITRTLMTAQMKWTCTKMPLLGVRMLSHNIWRLICQNIPNFDPLGKSRQTANLDVVFAVLWSPLRIGMVFLSLF